jgi:hypothetical protein
MQTYLAKYRVHISRQKALLLFIHKILILFIKNISSNYLGLLSLNVNHTFMANLKIGYDHENKVPTLGFEDMKI